MTQKNSFSVSGDVIYISRNSWNKVAFATIRDDYIGEIQSATWYLKNKRYPYSSQLGYLHHYIMKKWYGDEICQEMKCKGFVIDHMDNNSMNSAISNLCFLSKFENTAKGQTFDRRSAIEERIALSMTKDFVTGLFQISICFNHPPKLDLPDLDRSAIVEIAHLLYDCDYPSVINDADAILLDYENRKAFSPCLLRFVDYHIEGAYGVPITTEEYYRRAFPKEGPIFFINKLAPIENWTTSENRRFIKIS